MDNEDRFWTWIVILVIGCLTAAVGFGVYAIVESVRSNGEVDYCYVEMWSPGQMAPQWQLYGHRPWRTDRMMGVYGTTDEAHKAADASGCKLNVR